MFSVRVFKVRHDFYICDVKSNLIYDNCVFLFIKLLNRNLILNYFLKIFETYLGSLTLMQNKIDSLMNFYIRISEFCLNDSELDIKICVCYYKKKKMFCFVV